MLADLSVAAPSVPAADSENDECRQCPFGRLRIYGLLWVKRQCLFGGRE